MYKIGLHYENCPSEAQRTAAAQARLPLVKGVWPFPAVPGVLTVCRVWIGEDGVEMAYVRRGAEGARDYFERCLPVYQQFPGVVWEGPNEPCTETLEDCRVLGAFLTAWARLMHASGFLCAGPSLGEGQPGGAEHERRAKMAAMGAGIAALDYLALHCYWCPPLVGPEDIWHALRYRLNVQYLLEAGFRPPRVLITEAGIDGGVIGEAGRGYLSYGITEEEYITQCERYDAELCKDAYVVGAVIFGANPNPRWEPFRLSEGLQQYITGHAQPAQEPAEEERVFAIDGRQMTMDAFKAYLNTLALRGTYSRVVIHHTAIPDEVTWDSWGGWHYWKTRLVAYYANTKGWDRGPHLFVDQVGIGLFTPLTQTGRAIGGTAAEVTCRHIEIVGDFSTRLPDGARLDNAAVAAAVLLDAGGLTIDGLTYHQAMTSPGIACPGAALVAQWAWFKDLVAKRLAELNQPDRTEIERILGERMQSSIVPLNPTAALEKVAVDLGLLPAGPEFDMAIGDQEYRCQAYRSAGQREWQYGLYCPIGEWGKVQQFKRVN